MSWSKGGVSGGVAGASGPTSWCLLCGRLREIIAIVSVARFVAVDLLGTRVEGLDRRTFDVESECWCGTSCTKR